MDEEKAVEAISYPAHGAHLLGREIDVRPDPAGVRKRDATTALRRPLPEAWPDANTTGAFISKAASLRHEVEPYRWWDAISPGWLFLWLVLLGAPAVAGVWAAIVLWSRLRYGH